MIYLFFDQGGLTNNGKEELMCSIFGHNYVETYRNDRAGYVVYTCLRCGKVKYAYFAT